MVQFLLMTVVQCDFCSACCLRQTKIVYNLSFYFDCGYDCRKVLKYVIKSYDIFPVACDCHMDVVGLIHLTRFKL